MKKELTRIISLLNEKNHYLDKFNSINLAEIKNFNEGHFDNLEQFYYSRENILDVLKYIDGELEKAYLESGSGSVSGELENLSLDSDQLAKVHKAFAIKDSFVDKIIGQDIQILTSIEAAKNSILKEMQETKKNRKGLAGYKVNTFTKRLDEEV
jgi:hypothetical protein